MFLRAEIFLDKQSFSHIVQSAYRQPLPPEWNAAMGRSAVGTRTSNRVDGQEWDGGGTMSYLNVNFDWHITFQAIYCMKNYWHP